VRRGPAFDEITSAILSPPVPAVPEAIVIQGARLTAVHAHPAGAAIVSKRLPPSSPTAASVGAIVMTHAGACVNSTRCSLMTTTPLRSAAEEFAVTVYAISPLP
jgi:hypothetical protein